MNEDSQNKKEKSTPSENSTSNITGSLNNSNQPSKENEESQNKKAKSPPAETNSKEPSRENEESQNKKEKSPPSENSTRQIAGNSKEPSKENGTQNVSKKRGAKKKADPNVSRMRTRGSQSTTSGSSTM